MANIEQLLENNRRWASSTERERPGFFDKLARRQTPEFLWIGCSDSRVPANEIIGLLPGEVFVHRNVANLVIETDLNVLSVVQYAVDVLGVSDIIVCGHYGCGGVGAACSGSRHGLVDNWLRPLRTLASQHDEELGALAPESRADRLAELNVLQQTANLARTTVIEDAWRRGSSVTLHSWIYSLCNGLIKILADPIHSPGGDDEVHAKE